MSIHIQARGFSLTESLERYTRKRIDRGLGTFDHSIGKLRVGLTDVNGPKGGADKCCSVHITVPQQADVVVKETQPDMYNAIDKALRRARAVLRKRTARLRPRHSGRRGNGRQSAPDMSPEPLPAGDEQRQQIHQGARTTRSRYASNGSSNRL